MLISIVFLYWTGRFCDRSGFCGQVCLLRRAQPPRPRLFPFVTCSVVVGLVSQPVGRLPYFFFVQDCLKAVERGEDVVASLANAREWSWSYPPCRTSGLALRGHPPHIEGTIHQKGSFIAWVSCYLVRCERTDGIN